MTIMDTLTSPELNCHDCILPPNPGQQQTRNKTVAELKDELGHHNLLSEWHQYHLAELQEIVKNNNIETEIEKTRIKKG